MSSMVRIGGDAVNVLLNAVTTTATGSALHLKGKSRVFQATLSNTTTPTATVVVEGSIDSDATTWVTLGTITLSGALDSDGFGSEAPWPYVRGRVTAISGTSAAVTLKSNH